MMRKSILFTMSILFAVWLTSCSKTPQPSAFSASQVAGTYQGFLTATNFKTAGTADVSSLNDSMVSIHCYDSVGFDTTFMMQLYQNGDSVMLCSTGQAFFNQYGRYMNSMGSMMGGGSGMNEWQRFMNAQNDPGNGNYGSFDMNHGSFYYPFSDSTGTHPMHMNFNGSK